MTTVSKKIEGVAAIGEVMIELAPDTDGSYQMGFAGDTFNTIIGIARLGVPASYVTLLGDDSYSDNILRLLAAEHVDASLVQRLPGRQPGLYMIANSDNGERTFRYWRSEAPARQLWLDKESLVSLEKQLANYRYLYLSGITLAIMQPEARLRLLQFIAEHRRQGGRLVFDSNYRPRLWPDVSAARSAIAECLAITDIALLTLDDEMALWGGESAEQIAGWHREYGFQELVIKRGSEPLLLLAGGSTVQVDVEPVSGVIDTTGAGDAFNAGYLAGRLRGMATVDAAAWGNRSAAAVIRRKGGVVPRDYFLKEMRITQ